MDAARSSSRISFASSSGSATDYRLTSLEDLLHVLAQDGERGVVLIARPHGQLHGSPLAVENGLCGCVEHHSTCTVQSVGDPFAGAVEHDPVVGVDAGEPLGVALDHLSGCLIEVTGDDCRALRSLSTARRTWSDLSLEALDVSRGIDGSAFGRCLSGPHGIVERGIE